MRSQDISPQREAACEPYDAWLTCNERSCRVLQTFSTSAWCSLQSQGWFHVHISIKVPVFFFWPFPFEMVKEFTAQICVFTCVNCHKVIGWLWRYLTKGWRAKYGTRTVTNFWKRLFWRLVRKIIAIDNYSVYFVSFFIFYYHEWINEYVYYPTMEKLQCPSSSIHRRNKKK